MQKHAYLILAHANPEFLQTLVNCLDNPANDIFIHWDAKSGDIPALFAKHSPIRFTTDRFKVYWGDFSVVEAEYALFREARRKGSHQYYHLISGADLPIKTQSEIHRQCDQNPEIEYIGFALATDTEINYRVNHFFLFPHQFQSRNVLVKVLRRTAVILQDVFKVRTQKGVFKKGSQWVSVTESFVDYLLDSEAYVRKVFKHTLCPDELYKQTLCWNSIFRDRRLETTDEFEACRRFINWENGDLKELAQDDIPVVLNSNRWFARKFNPANPMIINQILLSINEYGDPNIHH